MYAIVALRDIVELDVLTTEELLDTSGRFLLDMCKNDEQRR